MQLPLKAKPSLLSYAGPVRIPPLAAQYGALRLRTNAGYFSRARSLSKNFSQNEQSGEEFSPFEQPLTCRLRSLENHSSSLLSPHSTAAKKRRRGKKMENGEESTAIFAHFGECALFWNIEYSPESKSSHR